MEAVTTSILLVLTLAAGCIMAGVAMLRRIAFIGWFLIVSGSCVVGGIAALQLTGRLGPAQLWFRAPTFYLAAAILLAVAAWWFRRPFDHPHARTLRLGIPATLLVTLGVLAVLARLDGRSTPISALMPTLRTEAPELGFIESSGTVRRLAEYRGQVVLVNFWATWCGPCRHEMPMLSSAQTEFRDDGLVVLYLSLEDPAVLEKFLSTHQFDGVQGRLAHADEYYRAGKIYPLSYLISRDGLVAKRWSGRPAQEWLRDSIRDEL